MGPHLFTLYLKSSRGIIFVTIMYADDIQIYLTCDPTQRENVSQTLSKMSTVMSEIKKWMLLNKLKFNQDKTEFFVISSRSHQKHLQNVSIALDGAVLKPSPSVRILGVVFNSQMTTDDQIINVSRNIRYHMRNLSRIRKYLNESSAHDAVRALVLSRLDYCNSLLYGTTQNLQRLQLLQNHAAKLVYNKPKFTRVTPLLNDLHWLPISKRIEFKIATLAYKALHNEVPAYTFLSSSTSASLHTTSGPQHVLFLHSKNPNNSRTSRLHCCSTTILEQSPKNIQSAVNTNQFKKVLKTYLFQM